MGGIFDVSRYWIPMGCLSFLTLLINVFLTLRGKNKRWPVWMFLSLTCSLMMMVCEYTMVYQWVRKEDMAALLDVVPTMSFLNLIAVVFIIIVNGIILFKNKKL